ncbi:hypothetical protein QCA50_012523 [Cerrena zonata]|uniref:F-box domain-containing protein n=1 Tax=Cerrena zonata TaxID=2478898 RepID=A0AAW0FYN1_9APHY
MRTEGTVRNDTACAVRTKPTPGESLALIRCIRNDAWEVEKSTEDTCSRSARKCSSEQVDDRSSRFPVEVYETIIDHVAEIFGDDRGRDLAWCACVCRAWVPRAQMHLFSLVYVYSNSVFQSIQYAIRRKPYLLRYINSFDADYGYMPRATNLLTTYRLHNLKTCIISRLELKTAHSSLFRFPSSATSLHSLQLSSCKSGGVIQLCRFLTSFRSLSILLLLWDYDTALRDQRDLSHLQFNRSKSSLQTLAIEFIRNISVHLKSFIRARPFVTHLKHLIISWHYRSDATPSLVQEIAALLWHCRQSLEEVTVILGNFWVSSTSSASSFNLFISVDQIVSENQQTRFFDNLGHLDGLLSDESFCSFRKLRVRAKILKPVKFPKLQTRKVGVEISDSSEYMQL